MNPSQLGFYICLDREALGISQSELARRLEVPSQSVSRWESSTMSPRDDRLKQLAEFFGPESKTAKIAKNVLEARYAARKKNGRNPSSLSKKSHTRRFEQSENYFQTKFPADFSYETDFYFSTDGYFIIEQEIDGMRVALTPQQLEEFLDMVQENDVVNEAYRARYDEKKRVTEDSEETS